MTVKYLIVESDLRSAELCARKLFQNGLISKRAEWKWIPSGRGFKGEAKGWYPFVEHDVVRVCGMIGKESFLRWYEERLLT